MSQEYAERAAFNNPSPVTSLTLAERVAAKFQPDYERMFEQIRTIGRVAVTNYSDRAWNDPDVEVRLVDAEGRPGVGFIDARRQLDGRWQAFVRYTLDGPDRAPYSGWFDYDDLEQVDEA